MAVSIELGPQVPIGVRIGYAKAPTAKMVVMSLTGGDITVTCAGASNSPVTVAVTATDTDGGAHSPAGYTAAITLLGLSEFTEYTYTVTQVGNAGNAAGTFRTLPSENDDFCFYVVTCDANTATSGGEHTGHGFYKNIRQQVSAVGSLPCVGIMHLDDHGYNSTRKFITGKADGLDTATPLSFNTGYAYCAAWLNYYGLHASPTGTTGYGDADLSTNPYANNDIGRNPDRTWCNQNLPVWPQWGDWEFGNDIGMDYPTSNPDVANGYHKTYTLGVGNKDGGGYLSWAKFMTPIQPPSIASADAGTNLWSFDLGCIRIIAPDIITNSTGAITNYAVDITSNDAPAGLAVTSMIGANQITDILAHSLHHLPFTFLGMSNGIRYMAPMSSEWQAGSQHPIKNHCPAEFASLFASAGSLSDKPATLFTVHGDYHNGHVYHHQITDGAIPTDFYEIGAGTMSRSSNFLGDIVVASTPIGQAFKGSVVEYIAQGVGVGYSHTYWGVKVSVFGSAQTREIMIELLGSASEVLWSGRFIGWKGTQKFAADFPIYNIVGPTHP